MKNSPMVLSLRHQNDVSVNILRKRLQSVLPLAMREAGIDMWLIISQEDDYDPIFKTMVPLRVWAPILQMLVFHDHGQENGVERINISMTDLGDLYQKPWTGRNHPEQWEFLVKLIEERDPERIGINIGSVEWAAGGLTHNLFEQLCAALPEKYARRLVSSETACTRWLETLADEELQFYPQAVRLTKHIIARCFSAGTITPGVTTTDDLEWAFWQYSQELGLEQSFIPFFNLVRSEESKKAFPVEDRIIRPGDLIHCDVGNRYMRLCSDLQEWAYVRRTGEVDAPAGLKALFSQVNRLQQVFMGEFKPGLSGDVLLNNILNRAKAEGIPDPRIYSHSLGYYLHEPGPLIGLPWEQVHNPGRGEVALVFNSTFTMELSISDTVPEWADQLVRFSCEQDVCFTNQGCQVMEGLQIAYHLI
jgi:Xaa-Pro aminopeptidase